jgi:transcriptional regulator NrdR family protein
MALRCPVCHGPTEVTETRDTTHGLRRRRRCRSVGCDGRLTTYEITVGATRPVSGRLINVTDTDVNAVASLLSRMVEAAE